MQTESPSGEPPKRKRRWYQFSLRTLMIVVTIVAVQCAVGLPMLKEWRAEREHIEELIKIITVRVPPSGSREVSIQQK